MRSNRMLGCPFCEFGPAVADIVLGVFGRHFDGAVQANIDVSAREGLHGADAGWRSQADPGARPASQLLGPHAVEFENTLAGERHLEPVEKLRSRIGLIVMLAVWEDRHLVEVFGEPRRGLGDVDKAVLDHCGLSVHAHRLVAGRLVARHAVAALDDELLDQLGARGLVLDQHDTRIEQVLLLAHRALERRIIEPPAEYTEEEEVLAVCSPSRAHREIAELARLVGGVPALDDAVEALGQVVLSIALEPFLLDQATAQRRRRLLILAGKVVFADRPPDAVEGFEWLALGCKASPWRRRKHRTASRAPAARQSAPDHGSRPTVHSSTRRH